MAPAMVTATSAPDASDERQIQVRFTTRLPPSLRVTSSPFAVPAGLTRYGLSDVINTLLGLQEVRPFDFLVEGELLRTSLDKFVLSKKLSAESILSVEYIPALTPPKPSATSAHNDWVSAVNGSIHGAILSGSYDSLARVFIPSGMCSFVLKGHSNTITEVLSCSSSDEASAGFTVLSASKDHSLRLWTVPATEDGDFSDDPQEIPAEKIFLGHKGAVQCAAMAPSGDEFCSGGWDNVVHLWRVREENGDQEGEEEGEGDDVPMADVEEEEGGKGKGTKGVKQSDGIQSAKKKRRGNDKAGVFVAPLEAAPVATLAGHLQAVASVEWLPSPDGSVKSASSSSSSTSIFSSSWDHTIREWSTTTMANIHTITTSRPVVSVSVRRVSSGKLIAAGSTDQVLRIWDTRDSAVVTPALDLLSHKSWISSVKWSPSNEHRILSASYDGQIKLWDIRGKIPLHTVDAHTDKILAADWMGQNGFLSGGADCQLRTFGGLN